jgi:hypothetical protein
MLPRTEKAGGIGGHSTLRAAVGSMRTMRLVAVQTAAAAAVTSIRAVITQVQSPVGSAQEAASPSSCCSD